MLEKVMWIILKRKINILPFGIFDYPIMGPDILLYFDEPSKIILNTAGKIYSPTIVTLDLVFFQCGWSLQV